MHWRSRSMQSLFMENTVIWCVIVNLPSRWEFQRRMHLYWQKVMFWSSIRGKERSLEKYRQEESLLMDLVSEMLVTSYWMTASYCLRMDWSLQQLLCRNMAIWSWQVQISYLVGLYMSENQNLWWKVQEMLQEMR